MPEEIVRNWSRLLHKNVRSSDGQDAGQVVHIAEDNLRIAQGSNHQYEVPKRYVDGFDGSEIRLSLGLAEMGNYRMKWAN